MKKDVWRAVTEIGFIIFLFYSNLFMGEFTRSGSGRATVMILEYKDMEPFFIKGERDEP
jgi:hypothetical protein